MPTNWKTLLIVLAATCTVVFVGGIGIFWAANHPAPAKSTPPASTADSHIDMTPYQKATARISTTKGDIVIALYPASAPNTVENFVRLTTNKFYDGLKFHRVVDKFVIQGGDPKGDGTGGNSIWNKPFADEINAVSLGLDKQLVKDNATWLKQMNPNVYTDAVMTQYANQSLMALYENVDKYAYLTTVQSRKLTVGSVAMANSGPNTNTSQFFIVTTSDQPSLDGKYTVFGQVTSGMDVIQKIIVNDVMNTVKIENVATTPASNTIVVPTQ